MSWWQVFQSVWQIASTVTPFLVLGGFAWLQTKFPSRADLKEHEGKLGALTTDVGALVTRMATSESRIDNIVRDLEREPTRAGLANSIADLRDRLGRVEASVQAVQHQLETQNDYLHALVQQGMKRS